jgi:hypothetical protein
MRESNMTFDITYIIDESSSMDIIANEVRSSINESLQNYLKEMKDIKTNISIISFNQNFKYIINNEPLTNEILFNSYNPNGLTALYDACGDVLKKKLKLINNKSLLTTYIIIIVTDGDDNSSMDYSSIQIKEYIKEFKNEGGIVIFTAANIDAFTEGAKLNINQTKSFDQTIPGNFSNLMRSVSSNITTLARDSSLGLASNPSVGFSSNLSDPLAIIPNSSLDFTSNSSLDFTSNSSLDFTSNYSFDSKYYIPFTFNNPSSPNIVESESFSNVAPLSIRNLVNSREPLPRKRKLFDKFNNFDK